ncbi:MAG: thiamine phosphate synthase [Candidatus Methanoplasma sp.]|jgi:thiamine-phosphate pyrophosphorylase|nr:thiamine phosphate synthase [Candidatus Methanoplasma sp.]
MIAAITDRKNCVRPFPEQIAAVAEAKPDMIILREKDLSRDEYADLARRCMAVCRANGVRLCVNTFADAAKDVGAADVQMPMPLFRDKKTEGFDNIIVSVHSPEEAAEARDLGADMVMFGNVFEALCKPGAPPKGLEALKAVCSAVDIPVLAVGGIDTLNMRSVLSRGAAGVCMMHHFMMAERPSDIVQAYREARKEIRG